jgi:hypothetical protein
MKLGLIVTQKFMETGTWAIFENGGAIFLPYHMDPEHGECVELFPNERGEYYINFP